MKNKEKYASKEKEKAKEIYIYKIAWLLACFLGDVKVIWCNSLDDSHFQTYVMNFVEIVIDYYLLITSHVSQVILVAHTTQVILC